MPSWTEADIAEAARLYQTGLSASECGKRFDPPIFFTTLIGHFRKMGIMRTSAEAHRTAQFRNKCKRRGVPLRERNPNWRGDDVTVGGGRQRAWKWFPDSPDTCPECGQAPTTGRMERHHRDHNTKNNSPENIQWLCTKCHRKRHPNTRPWNKGFQGEAHWKARLTDDDIRTIRALRTQTPTVAFREIARRFGVTPTQACRIAKRHSWKHVA